MFRKLFKLNCDLDEYGKIYYQSHKSNPKLGHEPMYSL